MTSPTQEQLDHWISCNLRRLKQTENDWDSGYYSKNNIPASSVYSGDAMDYASLARSHLLKCKDIETVRSYFNKAACSILRIFKIIYDHSDQLYDSSNTDFSGVRETNFIEGINYSLMSVNFKLSKELAAFFSHRPDGRKMKPEINDYAFGLKYTLLNEDEKALSILKPRLETYQKKPPKGGLKRNYHTLTTALVGILETDEALFNEGLAMQLHFYQGVARGEAKDTDEEYICDHACALANLGLYRGLNVTVEDPRLPKALLIEKTA